MESHLTISEVAQRTGLTAYTLRYYERIGLIAPVQRAAGGQRRYAAGDMEWLRFLIRLRETGMPIRQMQVYARLRSEGDTTLAARQALLGEHLRQVVAQIDTLVQTAQALQAKIDLYAQMMQPDVPAERLVKRKRK
jgi:DNA-binding transcriptional MerR regulator